MAITRTARCFQWSSCDTPYPGYGLSQAYAGMPAWAATAQTASTSLVALGWPVNFPIPAGYQGPAAPGDGVCDDLKYLQATPDLTNTGAAGSGNFLALVKYRTLNGTVDGTVQLACGNNTLSVTCSAAASNAAISVQNPWGWVVTSNTAILPVTAATPFVVTAKCNAAGGRLYVAAIWTRETNDI